MNKIRPNIYGTAFIFCALLFQSSLMGALQVQQGSTSAGQINFWVNLDPTESGVWLEQDPVYSINTNPYNLGPQQFTNTDAFGDSALASSGPIAFSSSSTSISGSGCFSVTSTVGGGLASDVAIQSTYFLQFTVDTVQSFTLSGNLTAVAPGAFSLQDDQTEIQLYDSNFNAPLIEETVPGIFSAGGVFTPGVTYTLYLSNDTPWNSLADSSYGVVPGAGTYTATSSYAFTLSVPEPATFGIFSAGATLLLSRRSNAIRRRTIRRLAI